MTEIAPHLSQGDVEAIHAGRHSAPFDVLGLHASDNKPWLVAYVPDATALHARFGRRKVELPRLHGAVFAGPVPKSKFTHTLSATFADGSVWEFEDPYRFGPVINDTDQFLFGEGRLQQLWKVLGAHVLEHEGVAGTHFAVWAPNAERVSVVGDFNIWDGTRHPLRQVGNTGIWEIFLPGLGDGTVYKYEIATPGAAPFQKADPVGFGAQHAPETASIVRDIRHYSWADSDWMQRRGAAHDREAAISIYEVHLGSWRHTAEGRRLTYRELAEELVDYATSMGFTHIECLPVSEFPFDGSWGYQPVGLYAPTTRFGVPDEFRALVDAAHDAGLGVIVDWVPGHFPADAHGLARFDSTHLYEHADPKEGFHPDWNTLIYNYGRTEVRNFLTANALYWLKEHHIDGLRVDAVASMLYRDYSRKDGEWIPNRDGGRENYEAIEFLREMNTLCYGQVEGVMTIAEESTAFPGVSTPVHSGGLGFGFKWNMGWMNDTLRYIEKDPIHRKFDHNLMTGPINWAFSENFILPISHDEVVHGKGSMIAKMPGNEWEKFANLRAYYGFMWGHPGKKLLFMGCEFAQWDEWNHDKALDWGALNNAPNKGVQDLIRDLNRIYRDTPALFRRDSDPAGFEWLANDPDQSLSAFARHGHEGDASVVVVCNFTPVERRWRIGVPAAGQWDEIMNTDASVYGGGNRGNLGRIGTQGIEWDSKAQSVELTAPPLSTIILRHCR